MGLQLTVLGLNCGTSVDGIDCALCSISQASPSSPLEFKLLKYAEQPVPSEARSKILRMIQSNAVSLEEVCQMGFLIGKVFADAALAFAAAESVEWNDVDIVASHGQTCWHIPLPVGDQIKSTLQMMESTALSTALNRTVVSDFRTGEVSVGRHGAPLVAFIDALVGHHDTLSRGIQNIGGIANVSFVPASRPLDVFDFDTGPGNVWIDAAMRHFTDGQVQYDKDGEWAKRGKIDGEMVEEVLAMEYFSAALPKTTGRELFGDASAHVLIKKGLEKSLSKEDIVATLTRITAQSIVDAYRRYLPEHPKRKGLPDLDELYLCGGGGFNPAIVDYIASQLPGTRIAQLDELGIPAAAKEAISFALLGAECVLGRSVIVPQFVDSRAPVVLGKITPAAANWGDLLGKVAGFREEAGDELPVVERMVLI